MLPWLNVQTQRRVWILLLKKDLLGNQKKTHRTWMREKSRWDRAVMSGNGVKPWALLCGKRSWYEPHSCSPEHLMSFTHCPFCWSRRLMLDAFLFVPRDNCLQEGIPKGQTPLLLEQSRADAVLQESQVCSLCERNGREGRRNRKPMLYIPSLLTKTCRRAAVLNLWIVTPHRGHISDILYIVYLH